MIARLVFAALSLAALAGCAPVPGSSATSDQVLAVQYRAQNAHGETSGAEASLIVDAYHHNISAALPEPAASATDAHQ